MFPDRGTFCHAVLWLVLMCSACFGTAASYQVVEFNKSPSHPMGAIRHACDRVCVNSEPAMTCKFTFTVEVYSALGRVSA